jgi:type IV pilus assembly protein PilN
MIKINLIAEGKKPIVAAGPRVTSEGADYGLWALVGFLLLGILVAGGHWFLLNRDLDTRQQQIADAQREVEELAPIIAEVEEYKRNKVELQRKISIINDLKSQQKVPVRVMDEVSAALPSLVWLTRMDDKKGTLVIAGRALNTNAVATFIESLDQVEFFDEPVLKNTQQRAGVYNFVINVKFTRPPEQDAERAGEGGV